MLRHCTERTPTSVQGEKVIIKTVYIRWLKFLGWVEMWTSKACFPLEASFLLCQRLHMCRNCVNSRDALLLCCTCSQNLVMVCHGVVLVWWFSSECWSLDICYLLVQYDVFDIYKCMYVINLASSNVTKMLWTRCWNELWMWQLWSKVKRTSQADEEWVHVVGMELICIQLHRMHW